MSSLILLPTIISAYNKTEQIVIFTANYSTLEPMRDLIRKECGINTGEKRFIIIGCQDIPGFDAVAKGEKVNSKLVLPAIVERAKQVVEYYKDVRAILLECTELPYYADSIRKELSIPVFDAISTCNFFINSLKDNPNIGENNWQEKWDGKHATYHFGENLNDLEKKDLIN